MLRHRIPDSSPAEREAAVREFREVAAERRRLAIRGARAVRELVRTGAHLHAGAASVAHFAEMNGMSAHEAREWAHLSRAIEVDPPIAADVEVGTIPVASAAVLGEIAAEPEIVRPEDRWVEWARSKSTRDLRRLFVRRRDEARADEPVTSILAHVTATAREDLERASALTSRRAHQRLTLGQTLGIVAREWLDEHDPLRARQGTRRLPDTSEIPDSRYVPADVDREIRARSGDRCIVPLCGAEYWVHRSHRVPHREGGNREAPQLDLLCDYHHRLYEAGLLRIEGPASRPVFTDARGNRIDERHPFAGDRGPPGGRAGIERPAADRPPPPGPAAATVPQGPTDAPTSTAPPGPAPTSARTPPKVRSRRSPTAGQRRTPLRRQGEGPSAP